ncbi:MAG: galactose oxidase-like domain-containing protein, partial [Nitrososphaera sp.]
MPDGKILVIGGTTFQNSFANRIMEAELFDPVTETWTTLPQMTVPRLYHSSAILLADGRVWVAGTSYTKISQELRVEYFVPSYYSAVRPTISAAPVMGNYGGTITISTPDGLDIDAVSLVEPGTETHAFASNQRLVWLQIQSKTATEVVVSAPINPNIAPPGYYYLFILKQGVPSVAQSVKVPGEAPVDADIPTISIVSPIMDDVVTGPAPAFQVTVSGTAADVGSGLQVVEVSVDGGAFTAATGTDSWS